MASQQVGNEEREGIVSLLRETVDGLRILIADHIKLARIEMVADAKTYGRSVAVLAVAGLVLAIGYVFALIAAALGLARILGAPVAFGAVAALHLVVGGIAVAWSVGKMRRTRLMHDTVVEAKGSISALARPLQGRAS
ncbi:MAG TPA: phage holin family protein [Polyangia bacterium]|nr:phage holin family protein [Polyangia bacterium]